MEFGSHTLSNVNWENSSLKLGVKESSIRDWNL